MVEFDILIKGFVYGQVFHFFEFFTAPLALQVIILNICFGIRIPGQSDFSRQPALGAETGRW